GRATSAPGSPNGSTATSKVRSPSSLRQPIYAPRSQCLLGTSLIIFRGQKFACCPQLWALSYATARRWPQPHSVEQVAGIRRGRPISTLPPLLPTTATRLAEAALTTHAAEARVAPRASPASTDGGGDEGTAAAALELVPPISSHLRFCRVSFDLS
uniref:Uncharacterized protein n=1 Tax=Aegilops tauschii subsp. strangulata TaxID=200361 RepID=A0A452XRA7_AEGTS